MSEFQFYLAIVIFLLTYGGIMAEKVPRTICSLIGGGAMIYFGFLTETEAFKQFIDWNTLGLLAGMMILISVVKKSGFFRVVALWTMKKSKGSPRMLLVLLSVVTAVSASFLDAVTAALLIAPLTISLCRMLKLNPVSLLVAEIFMCNVGGSGMMVGDPPNVMIGSATHLNFLDFTENTGPLAVITVFMTLCCIIWLFRKELPHGNLPQEEVDKIDVMSAVEDRKLFNRSLTVLGLTILGFIGHAHFGLDTATIAMTGAVVAMLVCGINPDDAMKEIDLDTLFFFMGLFVLVGGLEKAGVINAIAKWGVNLAGGDHHLITFLILWISGLASAFIDNIPFTATMIPLIKDMQSLMGLAHADYMWWALSVGACYGGNGTSIGASPNVIMIAIAAKEGHYISYGQFMKWCFPMMILSLIIGSAYIEIRYFMLAGL
jgi:Na+/H+ antiporter NhaD/arsenite permease-like protein